MESVDGRVVDSDNDDLATTLCANLKSQATDLRRRRGSVR
jgi:hypothetical protein